MFKIKPESYEGLALYSPIAISPKSDDQLKGLMVQVGSANASNNNPEILTESSAILDELLHSGKIDKKIYKLIYYKIKGSISSI